MGKYHWDESLGNYKNELNALTRIANELAEANRLTRLAMYPLIITKGMDKKEFEDRA